jgi:hypothetical protein
MSYRSWLDETVIVMGKERPNRDREAKNDEYEWSDQSWFEQEKRFSRQL